jgi:hypothetical protein
MTRRVNRYELKYVVDARRHDELVHDVRQFLVPDPRGDSRGVYAITSLYYDSPDREAYRSKIEGLKFRRKLRLRVYPPGGDVREVSEGHVEIKQRINRTVQKRRLVLPLRDAVALCRGDEPPGVLDSLDAEVASEVRYMVRAQWLRPTCIVSYLRQAFVAERFDKGMRVTLDTNLRGRMTALRVDERAMNRFFIPPDRLVLEVKVNERIPHFMVALLARHECVLTRLSKYCAVVKSESARLDLALERREDEPWMI